ncbi:MAG TPA: type II toxin-antitoxin system VapB family antitoxin [Blastocatellia bacterium]|nr:type II toxin-antitoxin system VapB family antitoxin [Blastocatellia bacterium]HMV84917.1 type II toxin-antitoxin system VapB family antitoxin [Blastocatellia bacterium]HMX27469.1 type II toxin-antitoxin system VapB family antitoxin [Blastocatellia bacterium]HMY75799.1 type II toxin-antitoxin system VapB family antitoxin [Blastocatellia bacterium]HMZ22329.1 type II toxin-antitoxin system VapB family antitoxin [Blastocatellia bacterium]
MANSRTAAKRAKSASVEIDESKLRRAQKLLGTETEAETVELALDEIIAERERNRRAWKATERLLKSGIQVEDVFGRLKD